MGMAGFGGAGGSEVVLRRLPTTEGAGMNILGVDIGLEGRDRSSRRRDGRADPRFMTCRCWRTGRRGRATINAPLLADLVRRANADQAFVELVTSRPTDGHVSAFSFGMTRGTITGVFGALAVPVKHVNARVVETGDRNSPR